MEARCLALLGGGAAKKVVRAAKAAMGKKPEKHIKSARPAEPAKPAAPAAEPLPDDYPAIFNFDTPEYWEDFKITLNMTSLKA